MAEPKEEKSTAQHELAEERRHSRNLFILFYTLRHFWKLNKTNVSELYKIVFPSKSQAGGNKTLYDNILKLQTWNALKHSKRLSELTGLSDKYFIGESCLSFPNLKNEDWATFIRLRKKRGSSKDVELLKAETHIKEGLKVVYDSEVGLSEPLKKLVFFAKHGHKEADKKIEDLFIEIERTIAKCSPHDFRNVSLALLENHQQKIKSYLDHIEAIVTVRKWMDTES